MDSENSSPFVSAKNSTPPIKSRSSASKISFKEALKRAIRHFSSFERAVFYSLFLVMALTSLILLTRVNSLFTDNIPVEGGSLIEGIIGSARYINPVIAISESDRDMTSLVYSGLTRIDSNGKIIPDLAEKYEVSDDGKTYTFFLKEGLTFHDGTPLSTDDIEFTIQKIQDPAIKSPKRANWSGVTIEKINEQEIRFHLKQPYAPFIYNTNVGILPKQLWKDLSAEEFPFSLFNFEPIGSGPYEVDSIKRTSSGIPESYSLKSFKKFALGRAYITNITIMFSPNEENLFTSYSAGKIDSVQSITPDHLDTLAKDGKKIITATLPRVFGVFFNQSQATVFLDVDTRKGLEIAVDREDIINKVFNGYAKPITTPLPFGIGETEEEKISPEERLQKAKEFLAEAGWEYNEEERVLQKVTKKGKEEERQVLAFSISTANAPELKETADILKETWEKLGARVDVEVYELGDLNQNVIRPRKYDALLFGEIIGRDMDLYAFWHSSQRNDPGLNVAMYTNTKTDEILEKARTIIDNKERILKYQEFSEEIAKETPAVFLYSPEFIYLLPQTILNVDISNLTIPSERFSEIYKWYVETEKVWKIFNR